MAKYNPVTAHERYEHNIAPISVLQLIPVSKQSCVVHEARETAAAHSDQLHCAMAGRRLPRWNPLQRPPRWSDVLQSVTRTIRGWIRASRECPDSRETPAQPTSPTEDVQRNL